MTAIIPDIASAFLARTHLFARERAQAFNQLVLQCALLIGGERLQHLVSVGCAAAGVCGQDSVRYQTYVAMAFSTLIMSVLLFAMSAPGGGAITRSLA
jgi:hypothetical protein